MLYRSLITAVHAHGLVQYEGAGVIIPLALVGTFHLMLLLARHVLLFKHVCCCLTWLLCCYRSLALADWYIHLQSHSYWQHAGTHTIHCIRVASFVTMYVVSDVHACVLSPCKLYWT